jgi:polysaccharide export outer membrane protein
MSVADRYISTTTPGNVGYLIGPQDVLEIAVFKVPELSKIVQVSEGGAINLPLVGDIHASGKTASEIERDLAAKLGAKYIKSPQVSVFVKEYNSQRITVEGAVKSPGVYPLRGHDSLLQSIAKAGGLDREIASSNVVIFRTTDGTRSAIRFEIADIRSGSSADPQVQTGDVIVVDDSTAKSAFQSLVKVMPIASLANLALIH